MVENINETTIVAWTMVVFSSIHRCNQKTRLAETHCSVTNESGFSRAK